MKFEDASQAQDAKMADIEAEKEKDVDMFNDSPI